MWRKCGLFTILLPCSFLTYASNDPSSNQINTIEEVYVTAQRKLQNNQQVSLAVTAVSSEQLSRGTLNNVLDVSPIVPGLVATSYNTANPQVFIRGIGSVGTSAAEESSVVFFTDEVFSGRIGTAGLDYLDIQRVEILRGPQGTLFGRNAAGGVVHVVTNKPTDTFARAVGVTLGSYNRRNISGIVNGRLGASDWLARLSMSYDQQDGYVENLTTGSDNLREYENIAGRLHLSRDMSENAKLLFTLDHAKSDALGPSTRSIQAYANPLVVAQFIQLPQPDDDIYKVTLAVDGPSHRETSGLNIKFDYELDAAVFESITGWRQSEYGHIEDISGAGLVIFDQQESSDLLTQEFKISAQEGSDIQWVAGVYYLLESVDRLDVSDLSGISDAYNLLTDSALPDNTVRYDQESETESYALYSQAEVPLTAFLNFVVGARFTTDKKDMGLQTFGNDFLGLGLLSNGEFDARSSKDFRQFSGKLGFVFTLRDNIMSYFTASQGYKAGGFNGIATSEESFLTPFDEETADSYEVGFKSEFWSGKLRSNIAIYQTDYQDLQVLQVRSNANQFIDNAASAKLKGLEWELSANITSRIHSRFSISLMDNEYENFLSAVDENGDGQADDLAGNQLTRSPNYSYAFSLNFLPHTAVGELDIQMQYQYQDDLFTSPQNRPLDKVDGYGLVDASIIYVLNSVTLNLFARNLLDTEYELHSYDADPQTRGVVESSFYGQPRMFGFRASYNF